MIFELLGMEIVLFEIVHGFCLLEIRGKSLCCCYDIDFGK
jgi:hypothetical protein